MSDAVVMWLEIGFNVAYLVIIWTITAMMFGRMKSASPADRGGNALLAWGFLLLALGDTGHVGFRVVAFAAGGLDLSVSLFGADVALAGLGSLATAYTVTILYMMFAHYWKRTAKPASAGIAVYWIIQVLLVARLVLMAFPQNQWGSVVPPATWGIVRNAPLTIAGLMIATAYLVSGRRGEGESPALLVRLAIYMYFSYAFYLPVIIYVRQVPMLGMLMIPKTVMYLLMAGDCYRTLFRAAVEPTASVHHATLKRPKR